MTHSTYSKERRILEAMRKALASIVRDTTPEPGMRHPLSERTREDIRACFGLIAARERELLDEDKIASNKKPRYRDEPRSSEVIHFTPINKNNETQNDPK